MARRRRVDSPGVSTLLETPPRPAAAPLAPPAPPAPRGRSLRTWTALALATFAVALALVFGLRAVAPSTFFEAAGTACAPARGALLALPAHPAPAQVPAALARLTRAYGEQASALAALPAGGPFVASRDGAALAAATLRRFAARNATRALADPDARAGYTRALRSARIYAALAALRFRELGIPGCAARPAGSTAS
jgi:hypothetical protein